MANSGWARRLAHCNRPSFRAFRKRGVAQHIVGSFACFRRGEPCLLVADFYTCFGCEFSDFLLDVCTMHRLTYGGAEGDGQVAVCGRHGGLPVRFGVDCRIRGIPCRNICIELTAFPWYIPSLPLRNAKRSPL